MLYTNDDLNNLFKKAAKDYPLRTDSSNWDDVAAKLSKSSTDSFTSKGIKALKYAMVILLAGGSLIFYKFRSASDFDQNERKKANNKVIKRDTQKVSVSSNTTKASTVNFQIVSPIEFQSVNNRSSVQPYNYSSRSVSAFANIALTKHPQLKSFSSEQSLRSGESFRLPSLIDTKEDKALNYFSNKQKESQNPDTYDPSEIATSNDAKSGKSTEETIRLAGNSGYKIYGTFYAGPEFSTVKFQKIDKPGYKLGISLGYRINKNTSIEVGLQREHLNFYSSGDYLDTTLLRIKPGTDIDDVTVNSKLTSVPVSLRYDFPSKSRGRFYTSAGINAVIITHSEQYHYSISKNGVPADISRSYSALTGVKYFSGVNFTAGYEKDVSRCWSLKVESYYQTPVNNLGVGKLPVTSFGINVGISKNLK
jgi:opacity protein-like surface antigen